MTTTKQRIDNSGTMARREQDMMRLLQTGKGHMCLASLKGLIRKGYVDHDLSTGNISYETKLVVPQIEGN